MYRRRNTNAEYRAQRQARTPHVHLPLLLADEAGEAPELIDAAGGFRTRLAYNQNDAGNREIYVKSTILVESGAPRRTPSLSHSHQLVRPMDHLRLALSKATGTAAAPPAPDPLPDPLHSPWYRQLRGLGADLPAQPGLGQLRQRSDLLVKELKKAGRGRESAELQKLRDDYEKSREKAAWSEIKARFEALALPERAYRAIKQQENLDPAAVMHLLIRKGETLKGTGADRVRDFLLGKAG